MRSAAQAYGMTAKQGASPRELEARLLLQAAARLQAILDATVRPKEQIEEALLFNRRLWTIFLSSIAEADCQLPLEIRRNVGVLGKFVVRECIGMLADPQPQRLSALVSINRELAAGLRGVG
jgi:flagellar protein FlaF